jgi:hypothetical protein
MTQQAQLHVAQHYLAVLVVLAVVLAVQVVLMVETGFGQTVSVLAVELMAQQVVFANLLKIAMLNQNPLHFLLLDF